MMVHDPSRTCSACAQQLVHAKSCHAMPCHAMRCVSWRPFPLVPPVLRAMPCHAMPCHAICRWMQCRAMSIKGANLSMPCNAMPCRAMCGCVPCLDAVPLCPCLRGTLSCFPRPSLMCPLETLHRVIPCRERHDLFPSQFHGVSLHSCHALPRHASPLATALAGQGDGWQRACPPLRHGEVLSNWCGCKTLDVGKQSCLSEPARRPPLPPPLDSAHA